MMSGAWKRLRALMSEFGMTLASRNKVSSGAKGEADPHDAFLKKRK